MKKVFSNSTTSKLNPKQLAWIILLGTFLLIHLIAQPTFGDDTIFRDAVQQNHYHILHMIFTRYFSWSSRFILDLFMLSFPVLPPLLWKLVDIIMLGLIFYTLSSFTKHPISLALLLCAYPFMHMASAGWIATTTIYIWPFASSLLAFYLLYNLSDNQGNWLLFPYLLLVLYGTNNEIFACLYFYSLILYIIIQPTLIKTSSRKRIWIISSLIISLLNIINSLVCPGNNIRLHQEVSTWMPNFFELSFWDKLRLCIVSTMQHFTSIPNVIFVLFSLLILVLCWKKSNSYFYKLLGCMPFAISVCFTTYYFVQNIIIHKNLNYLLPNIFAESGSLSYIHQLIIVLGAIIYLIIVLLSLGIIYSFNSKALLMIGIYLGSLASRFVLVFSPTMLASGTRIYFCFYMGLIWITHDLVESIKNPLFKKLCYAVLAIGIMINLIMVYMMQHKYG